MTKQLTEATQQEAQKSEKLFMENTLLRVSGALFCHDAKRAPKRTEETVLNNGMSEKRIVIRPDMRFGQPGPLAHRLLVAIIKKHSDYGRPIQKQVSFSQREIMRLIGRSQGGSAQAQIIRALQEIRYTHVIAFFKQGERFFERDFSIFNETMIERRSSHTAPIVACSVTLADPIVVSLQDDHFTCLNHFLMQRLGTIGQALYIRLFFHFANLYEEKHRKRGLQFHKHYSDICAEWLGCLTVLQHKSKIVREQLGIHLDQLVQTGVLSSYSLGKAKTRDGFVFTFRPGSAFFNDYERFYRHRHQGELQWDFHADRREIAEPLRLAYLFEAKRNGVAIDTIASAPSAGVDAARAILDHISIEEADAFLDFSLSSAKGTNFNVQTLGGLKQYINPYCNHREQLALARRAAIAKRAKEVQEAEQLAYDRFRRQEAERIFERLGETDKAIIEADARARAKVAGDTSFARTILGITRTRIVLERQGKDIPSFEDWKAARGTLDKQRNVRQPH